MPGITYIEEYPVKIVPLAEGGTGTVGSKQSYLELDIASKQVTIYNSDYGLSRTGVEADKVEYESDTTWARKDHTQTPVFKQDFRDGVIDKPRVSTSLDIMRGNAAAFEKHLKISEVNTMEDLENYRNNEFNL